MKKVKTTLNIISFILALPIAGITYYLVDNYRAIKKKKKEIVYRPTFHTYYPENYPENPTVHDFNAWSEHIYKQLDNLKN